MKVISLEAKTEFQNKKM